MYPIQQSKKHYSKAILPLNRTTHGATPPASQHPPLGTISSNLPTTHSDAKIAAVVSMHETVHGLHTLCDAIDEVQEFISDPNASQAKQRKMTNNLDKIQLFLDQTSTKIGQASKTVSPIPRLNDAIVRFSKQPPSNHSSEFTSPMEDIAAMIAPPTKA
jgi:hypothetical protein